MSKLTKISTIVALSLFVMMGSAHAKKVKNPTLKKVRKTLWYMGVNGPSMEAVELQIAEESEGKKPLREYPEELSKALKKAKGL